MRFVRGLAFLLVLPLGACSMFGHHEKVESGYVGTAAMNEQQVERLLFEQGYTDITGLHKNGNDWIGSGMNRDRQQVNFDIDKSGVIHTK